MNTLLYKNVSLTLYSWKGWCFCGVWEMGEETYSQREDFFFPSSSRSQGVPTLSPPCKTRYLWLAACPLLDCDSLDSLNLTTWFPSRDLLLVTHLWYPSALIVVSSSCLLIKMWQLAKAQGVTRNELKIHAICYITFLSMPFFKMSMYGHFLHVSLHLPSTPDTKQKQKKLLEQQQK